MPTIYRKTAKGQAEIETRAHGLAQRQRSALIMVDGKRSDDELRKFILGEPEATLAALLAGGFIEAIAVSADPARPPPRPAAPPAATPVPVAPPPAAPRPPAVPLPQLKRDAVRALTDAVGPMGEAVALKIEKAGTPAELRPALELAHKVIANTRGSAVAEAFAARFLAG